MSKARAKGTTGEQFFLTSLRRVFGQHVERAPLKGTLDAGDYVNVPVLCESKNTARPLFQQWARTNEKKAGKRWFLFWKGDLRSPSGNGPYVLLPLELWEEMALAWNKQSDRDLYRVDI